MSIIILRIFALTVLIQSATAATTRGNKEIISISWADEVNKNPNLIVDENLIPQRNESCQNNGVCNNVNNYPLNIAIWVLHQLTNKNMTEFNMEKETKIVTSDSHFLCSSTEKTYFPKAAYSTTSNTWKFILNLDIAKFQGFYINMCNNVGTPCNGITTSYTTSCEQSYTEKKMVYLDLKRRMASLDTFKVPICCSCKVMSTRK